MQEQSLLPFAALTLVGLVTAQLEIHHPRDGYPTLQDAVVAHRPHIAAPVRRQQCGGHAEAATARSGRQRSRIVP